MDLDKKPDMETELFRSWAVPKDDKEELGGKGFKINYKGMELNLTGFTIGTDKTTNELIFAYKFKHEDKIILYYTPDVEKAKSIIEPMKDFMVLLGFQFQDMTETLESVYQEYKLKTNERRLL